MKNLSFLGSVTVVFWGCILSFDHQEQATTTVPGCQASNQCPSIARCTLGACTVPATSEDLYRLRLIPGNESNFETLDIIDVRVSATGIQELGTVRVPAPIKTSGTVRAGDENVEADVIAISDNETSAPIRIEATTSRQGNISTFQITLPSQLQTMSGTTRPLFFDLLILPRQKDQMPPSVVSAVQATALTPPYFVELPSIEEAFTIRGRVLFDAQDRLPVSGLNVMLIGDNDRRLSTLSATDAQGRFELKLWSDDVERVRTLIFQSPSQNFPRMEISVTLSPDVPLQFIDDKFLNIPGQFIDWRASVFGNAGLPNAAVSALSDLNDGFIYTSIGASDADGSFQMRLIPGAYLFQVIPPIESPFGMLRTYVDVSSDDDPVLRPPLKTSFAGLIKNSDGTPLENTTVKAVLLNPSFNDVNLQDQRLLFGDRVTYANSDERGFFEMPLEPGEYRFTLSPPIDTGLPPFSTSVICPQTTGTLVRTDFVAPASNLLTFRLVDTSDLPISRELVELWNQSTQTKIATARSNDNGYVLLRFPASVSAQ